MDFKNQASLSYNNKIKTSNIVTGTITQGITISKSSRTAAYSPGNEIYYAVTINNQNNVTYENMTLTDNLGRYLWNGLTRFLLEYIPNSAELLVSNSTGLTKNAITGYTDDNGLNFYLDIPADSIVILSYIAKPTIFASFDQGASIPNVAALAKYSEGTPFDPISSYYSIPSAAYTDIRISKTIDNDAVALGQQLTYSLNVLNFGNTADTPQITDIINPGLPMVSVYGNGAFWTEGVQYYYETDTGLLTVNKGAFTVNAAEFTTGLLGSTQTVPSSYEIKVTGIVRSLQPFEPYFNIIPAFTDGLKDNINIERKTDNRTFIINGSNLVTAKCEIITIPNCDLTLTNDLNGQIKLEKNILTYGTSTRRADQFYDRFTVTASDSRDSYMIQIYALH